LRAEFAVKEDRRQCPPATEVKYTHARPEVERLGKPFGHPQGVGRAADAGEHPLGVVAGGAGESIGDQIVVHVDAPLVA